MSVEMKRRLIAVLAYLTLIIIGAILLLPDYWYLWAFIAAICLIRILVLLLLRKAYRCESCGNVFRARRKKILRPSIQDIYSRPEEGPKCPKCGGQKLTMTKMRT